MSLQDAVTINSSAEEDYDEDDLCIVCSEKLREVIFNHRMHLVGLCSLIQHMCNPSVAAVFSCLLE